LCETVKCALRVIGRHVYDHAGFGDGLFLWHYDLATRDDVDNRNASMADAFTGVFVRV
jgi:hypothetical protein